MIGTYLKVFFIFLVLLATLADLVQNVLGSGMDKKRALFKTAEKRKTCLFKTFKKGLFLKQFRHLFMYCFDFCVEWLAKMFFVKKLFSFNIVTAYYLLLEINIVFRYFSVKITNFFQYLFNIWMTETFKFADNKDGIGCYCCSIPILDKLPYNIYCAILYSYWLGPHEPSV